jgi:hypothetical protein
MADLGDLTSLASILTAALSYLLGSIPFGLLVTRLGGAGDVRSIGSGNIGATNVLRTGRKELALATLVLDAGKGAVAVLVARQLFDNEALTALAGASAFLGHLFPVWLEVQGGQGRGDLLWCLAGRRLAGRVGVGSSVDSGLCPDPDIVPVGAAGSIRGGACGLADGSARCRLSG